MNDKKKWMIYGANGFTGRLIAEEAKRQGLAPILAGRSSGAVEALARELALPCSVFDLSDRAAALSRLRRLNRIRRLLAVAPVQALAKRIAGRVNTGPSPERFASDTTYVWGEARNSSGSIRTARLTTSNGYRLTVDGVLRAVQTLLQNAPDGGYYTPSQLMGPRCVEELPGSSAIEIN